MIRTVVTRVHRPVAALFGVPRKRQLDQLIAGGPMHVSADVIAGTQNVVDLLLEHIDLFAIGIDLVSALIVFAIAAEHGEIAVRCLMVKGVVLGVVFYGVRGERSIKGSRHTRSPIGLPNVSMTAGARFGAHIAGGSLGDLPAL